ncbi:MAG: hypothetical protein KAI94_08495 [Anaerolineales bacterium]|nr:hypothetical protein [Anaerolineales bacterium]
MNLFSRILILLTGVLVSGCVGLELPAREATPAPWDPVPGDSEMQRGEIELMNVDIIPLESDPSQFALQIDGALPTPCHLLRVEVSSPDDQSSIEVEIYSIADPDQICIQVLEPFSEEIPLGDLTSSEYQVFVNDELVGELPP